LSERSEVPELTFGGWGVYRDRQGRLVYGPLPGTRRPIPRQRRAILVVSAALMTAFGLLVILKNAGVI
jgi:hypothetical protein